MFLSLFVEVDNLSGLDYIVFGDAQTSYLSFEGVSIDWICGMRGFLMRRIERLTFPCIVYVFLPITAIFIVMLRPFLKLQDSSVSVLDGFVEHDVDITEVIILQKLGSEVKSSPIVKTMQMLDYIFELFIRNQLSLLQLVQKLLPAFFEHCSLLLFDTGDSEALLLAEVFDELGLYGGKAHDVDGLKLAY